MLKLIGGIVSLLNYAKDIIPKIISFVKSRKDAAAIRNAKDNVTDEERAKSAKELFDRTNS